MRIRLYAAAIFAVSLLPAAHAFGQRAATDLTMRRALYFMGAKADKIETKNERFVTEDGTALSQADATKCEDGKCYFKVGFIAFRTPADGALMAENTPAGPQSELRCPESVVVGILDLPAGWADYSKREILFADVTIRNTPQGAYVTCNYTGGSVALDRFLPGRACARSGPNSPSMSCRAIPTKK